MVSQCHPRIFSTLRDPRDRVPFRPQSFTPPGFCVTCRWALTSMGTTARATRIAQLLGLAPAPPPPGRIPAMLAARRRTIDNVVSPTGAELRTLSDEMTEEMEKASAVFPKLTNLEVAELAADAQADRVLKDIRGSYWVPAYKTPYRGIVTYQPGDRMLRRHEVMHAYNHAAASGAPGMPLWSRVAASSPPSLRYPLDELLAQRAGGTPFMEIPWDIYASSYERMNEPGAARVAQGLHAAQKAGRFASDYAPYVAAGAAGTGMLAYGLSQDDEEEQDRQAILAYLRSVTPK